MRGRRIGATFITCAALAIGQNAAVDSVFEVASIRPSDPQSTVSIRRLPGGRFTTSNASLRLLITWTYDIGDERLIAAPGWLDSARFDIAAKAPSENPTQDGLHSMMKALLADRFGLRVHSETKNLSIFTLVVERDGPKVQVLPAPLTVNHDPFQMKEAGKLIGKSVTTEMLAKVLTNQLGHNVQDRTGFEGFFDFALEWRPDSASPDDTRASIFTAIREQLGFRLNSGKAPVEVIVIDHIVNQPTEN